MEDPKTRCTAHPTPMMQIIHLSKLFRDQLRRASEEAGIPGGYRAILMELSHSESATQYELARRTHLTAPTVSVTLQKMEHDGYITRTPDENDLRQMRVALTDKGKAAEADNRSRADALELLLLDGLTPEQQQLLHDLLTHMETNLHRTVGFCAAPSNLPKKGTDQ